MVLIVQNLLYKQSKYKLEWFTYLFIQLLLFIYLFIFGSLKFVPMKTK